MLCAAEELVGVVMSMGSPAAGDGADVLIIGVGVGGVVMMGIVRAPRPSSGSRPGRLLGTCSVAAAIGSTMVQVISMIGNRGSRHETKGRAKKGESEMTCKNRHRHGHRSARPRHGKAGRQVKTRLLESGGLRKRRTA